MQKFGSLICLVSMPFDPLVKVFTLKPKDIVIHDNFIHKQHILHEALVIPVQQERGQEQINHIRPNTSLPKNVQPIKTIITRNRQQTTHFVMS